MANVVSTAFSVGNGFSTSGESATDLLVAAYRKTRQAEIDKLKTREQTLQTRQLFFNSLRSRLETVQSQSDSLLSSDWSTKFVTRKVSASDATVVGVTASSTATTGVSTIKVQRLATNDVLYSDRETLATSLGVAAGAKTFSVGGRSYSVTLDGTETNEQAMQKIVSAVNADSNKTVTASLVKDTSSTGRLSFVAKNTGTENRVSFTDTDGLLSNFGLTNSLTQTSTEGVPTTTVSIASLAVAKNERPNQPLGTRSININGGTYTIDYDRSNLTNEDLLTRLSEAVNNVSGTTGITATLSTLPDNKIRLDLSRADGGSITINDNNFFGIYGLGPQSAAAQVTNTYRTKSTATRAGYGASDENSLDSLATINGVDIRRSKNSYDDVLSGVTFNLLKAQASTESAVTLTTEVDTDKVETLIKPLLDSYNEALSFLRNQSRNAGNDGSIRNLQTQLRGLSGERMASAGSDVRFLADAGIKIGTDGSLSIGNKETLKNLLETAPSKVAELFGGSEGLATKMKDLVDDITGSNGVAQKRSDALLSQITRATTNRKNLESRIEKAVEQTKKEYRQLQETYAKLQSQATQYSTYS